jgi:tight adherence protein C
MGALALVAAMFLMFASITVLTHSLLPVRGRARLGVRRSYEVHKGDRNQIESLWFKWTLPLVDPLVPLTRRLGIGLNNPRIATKIQKAALGEFMDVAHVRTLQVLSAIVVPLLAQRLFVSFSNPAVFLAGAIGAFYLPEWLLDDTRRQRERRVLRALPGSVDVLSLSVEAGLDFLGAIQRQVERGTKGPLRDELATILHDIRLGSTRGDALKAFATRVEIPEIVSFVSVLVQADMLGAPIGSALKTQAERMRVERFQRAEKAGARATQKILFPLVLFIFPAVLIVIIGPVILQVVGGGQ